MHRIPLRIQTASLTWNRMEPEYLLFERTLNCDNVKEMNDFMEILERESDIFYNKISSSAQKQIHVVNTLLKAKQYENYAEILPIVNGIILRAPINSVAFSVALKTRGNYFFENFRLEDAASDFEMFLFSQHENSNEELCKLNGILAICFYLLRNYDKSKKYVKIFKRFKGKLTPEILRRKAFTKIEYHVSTFSFDFNNIEDIIPKFEENISFKKPFMGFNSSSDIPLTSASCSYRKFSKTNGVRMLPGVYANCTIPKESIVLVEHPMLQTMHTPFVQCELCFIQSDRMYTCLLCRYKTYCSLQCMQKDKILHRMECIGYKHIIIQILDVANLFRMFVRTSELLNNIVFSHPFFGKEKIASGVMVTMKKVINEKLREGRQYLPLLVNTPDYNKLSNLQYSTLVATAFRLTMYIEKNTPLIDSYYNKLLISNKQKMIVVGSILMRLNCHLLNNTFDFEYVYSSDTPKPNYVNLYDQIKEMVKFVKPNRDMAINNIHDYYNINTQSDDLEKKFIYKNIHYSKKVPSSTLPVLIQSMPCHGVSRLNSIFKDNIIESYFCSEPTKALIIDAPPQHISNNYSKILAITTMSGTERCQFVERFTELFHNNYADFFLKMFAYRNCIQQVISIFCTTVGKFQHSCDPNVEIIVLPNGMVMGKTIKDIAKGDELFISYKANFTTHTRLERKSFLQGLHLECDCKYCQMPVILEPTNMRQGIFCDNCEDKIITPIEKNCSTCNVSYNNLLLKYRTELKLMRDLIQEKTNPNGNDREIYIMHYVWYLRAKRHFVPTNEYRINASLQFAKYLALKNFAKQAFHIIMEIRSQLKHYEERFLWFTFYFDMLNIIKIILYYNLEENIISMSLSSLHILCKLGLHILNGQKNILHFHEMYDNECGPILKDLRIFLQWRENIICNDISAQADSLINTKPDHKSRIVDILPTLLSNN